MPQMVTAFEVPVLLQTDEFTRPLGGRQLFVWIPTNAAENVRLRFICPISLIRRINSIVTSLWISKSELPSLLVQPACRL